MNDPAVKASLAISILIGGIFIAIVFRPVFTSAPSLPPEINAALSLHHQRRVPIPSLTQQRAKISTPSVKQELLSSTSESNPTIITPLDIAQPVPNLPPRYPVAGPANSARWGLPPEMMPVVARTSEGPLTHKIVDGDSLADLAARYLGSASRATEIFQANFDILNDPDLLPIGAELKIPAR